jgi:hypothetical protein
LFVHNSPEPDILRYRHRSFPATGPEIRCCLAAPAPEFLAELFAVIRAVHMHSLVVPGDFADNVSICFDPDLIPFHGSVLRTYRMSDIGYAIRDEKCIG